MKAVSCQLEWKSGYKKINGSLFHRYAWKQLCQYHPESSIHEYGEEKN